ncbi:peptidoglycan recognition family protein [Streptomyces sp. CS014]|uniref:N-acetylmuramoyl-L-alanine amidase n=1 Tax=Streptomyces sp. CS014 TaxID=2162707 RepID=UPI000D51CF0F|nr:peptidoglycan recognition family protein [Streptomyces sp. CS014]PVD01354.1 N-acetylmuramoyl-L-alanine amidase [Streptomyces sp. CS014]
MATPLSAAAFLAALRAEGVKVSEHRSWRTHNRNHKGSWGPVHGVMIHHTVSSGDDSSVELCYNGHSALPGPLCHGVGRNDGTVALVSSARANHAGLGDDDVLRAVINETALPPANEANTDGNRHFYGLEIVNLGDNKDTYTKGQYRAAVLWAAALCRAHGWSERSVIGHKEWQPGKIDPRGPIEGGGSFSMSQFRADVRAQLATKPGAPSAPSKPTPPKEDPDVALSDADIKKVADAVVDRLLGKDTFDAPKDSANYSPDPKSSAHYWTGRTLFGDLINKVRAINKKVDALADAQKKEC